MCGINGFNYRDPSLIDAMTKASNHRGPDYVGIYSDPEITIAHSLLAIRGPAGACRQPIHGDSEWVLAFVGEIYNTDQIKRDFVPEVTTEIDTHILQALVEKTGWDFVRAIHGMYAIALYNKKERRLRLYRDPSGQKCLYYYAKGDAFAFSSEIRPLTKQPDADLAIDGEAIRQGTLLGYVPFEKTIFKHIRKLRIGEVLTLDLETATVSNRIQTLDSMILPEEDADPHRALSSYLRQHFVADVPVALNLSGGMDSSILLQEMIESGMRFEAFTTHFDVGGPSDQYNEEFELAKRLCAHYSVPHRGILVTREDYLNSINRAYETIEEPNYNIGNPIYLQTASAEGMGGAGYRVVLSGDGGDEVFSGYPHYRRALQLDRIRRLVGTPAFSFLMNRKLGLKKIDFGDPSNLWLRLRASLSGPEAAQIRQSLLDCFPLFSPARSLLQDMMQIDRILWVSSENLIRSDKLFMSASIELRAPFCYHPLRTYFDRRLRTGDYLGRDISKVFLRNAYEKRLPEFITHRKRKWGWRPPLNIWYGDPFRRHFLEVVESGASPTSEWVDWSAVRSAYESSGQVPGKSILFLTSLAGVARSFGIRI